MKKRHGIFQAKSHQTAGLQFLAGFVVIVLMAMFTLAGCKTEAEDGDLALTGTIKIQKGGADVTTASTGDTLSAVYNGSETGLTYQWNKDGTAITTG